MIALFLAAALFQDETVVDGTLGAELDRTIQRETSGGYWGVALVARKGQVILSKGYGFADYGKAPNTPGTLFEIATVSKQFTAAAILKLEMEKKLATSDTLEKFFRNVPEDKKKITVQHLLDQTSGLSPEFILPDGSTATRDELVDGILKLPVWSVPGETFDHSNVPYTLLAAIVEVASGGKLEDYLRTKIFEPAGLANTGFIGDKKLKSKRVSTRLSKLSRECTAVDWYWGWAHRGTGGVVTSAVDLLAWDRALRGDKVLDEAARTKLITPVKSRYACGSFVHMTVRGTTKVHHAGGVEGYSAQFSRYLEEETVIVLLSNSVGDIYHDGSVVSSLESRIGGLLFPRPRVEATIDFSPYTLNKEQAARYQKATWEAKAEGDAVLLKLIDGQKHVAALIRMPKGVAKKLLEDVKEAIEKRKRDAGGDPGMQWDLNLLGYTPTGKELKLSEGLEILLTPLHRSTDGVDKRATFVLNDTGVGRQPLVVRMNLTTAVGLLQEVEYAVR